MSSPSSPTLDGPRRIHPEEFRETMALTERCFGFETGGLEARMPHCFDESRPERHAIVKRDGEVVAHVVCVPAPLHAGDARIECHGIAGVATHPDHRGNGYMRALLEFWLDDLDDRGVPLAELEGDRVGYGRFGWENAGREVRYEITNRSFHAGLTVETDSVTDAVHRYEGAPSDLESIETIHEEERYRVHRDRERAQGLFEQRGLETLIFERAGEEPAYCCHRGEEPTAVLEFGGSERGLETLLGRLLEEREKLAVYTHPHHPHCSLFTELASTWTVLPHRKLNVLDLPALLEAYTPLLTERWLEAIETGVTAAFSGALTLAVLDDDEFRWHPTGGVGSVTLEYDRSGVRVEHTGHTDREPDVVLDRRATTRLLFGSPDANYAIRRAHPFLATVLPLEYYFWQTETI